MFVLVGLGCPLASYASEETQISVVRHGVAPDCIDATALRVNVTRKLGFDPFSGDSAPRLVIRLQGDEDRIAAQVTLVGPTGAVIGERQLSAASCTDLDDALALALDIALDREGPRGAPVQLATPELVHTADSSHSRSIALWLGVGMAGAFQTAPTSAIATSLQVEGRSHWFAVALEARLVVPVAMASAEGGQYGEQLLLAAIVPCVRWGLFGGCAVFTAGAARLTGNDYLAAQSSVTPYAALGARASADWSPSPHWCLRGQAEVLFPVVKPSINLGTSVLWSQPPVSLGLGAAVLVLLE